MASNGTPFSGAALSAQIYDGLDRLGHLVWQDVGDVEGISFDEARKIIAANGGEADHFPPQDKKKAYHQALRRFRVMDKSADNRVLIRPLPSSGTGKMLRHQVTLETASKLKDGSEGLDYRRELFVSFDRETQEIAVTKESGAKWTALDKEFKQSFTRTFDDLADKILRRDLQLYAILRIRSTGAVAMRQSGGLWFVPEEHTSTVRVLESVFEDFERGCTFYAHPILDTTKWRAKVAGNFDTSVESDIDDETQALQALIERGKTEKEGISARLLNTRLGALDKLVTKTGMYERLLNFRAEKVRKSVEALQRLGRRALSGDISGLNIAVPKSKQRAEEREQRRAAREAKKAKKATVKKTTAKKAKTSTAKKSKKATVKKSKKATVKKTTAKKAKNTRRVVNGVQVDGTPPVSPKSQKGIEALIAKVNENAPF